MFRYISKQIKISQALICISIVFGFWFVATGETIAADDINQKILDLRQQIEQLTKQADQYKGNIAKKQKEADTLKRQIDILNNQILALQTRITITERQISSTKLEITDLEGQIFDAQEKINKEKRAIGDLLSILFERDKLSLVAVIMKSSSLSSFTDQAQQEQNLNNKLVQLLSALKVQKDALETDKTQLEQKRAELEALNQKQVNQQNSLSGNKKSKNLILAETRGQEAQYQKLLNDVEKKKAEFFSELQNLESQAIKTGAYIVHVTADSVPPRGTKIFRWPYDDYILTQGYGMTAYARRGVYGGAPHNGVDITAGYGSAVRPLAAGAILASGYNNGWGNWVAVRHDGGLVTLYAHMKAPSGLANGTPVSTGSVIGYEGSTGNSTGSHLHISVYKDFFTYINAKNGQIYFNYFEGTLNPFDYLP